MVFSGTTCNCHNVSIQGSGGGFVCLDNEQAIIRALVSATCGQELAWIGHLEVAPCFERAGFQLAGRVNVHFGVATYGANDGMRGVGCMFQIDC